MVKMEAINDAPYGERFLWALLPMQILRGEALSTFMLVSEGKKGVFVPGEEVSGQNEIGPLLTEGTCTARGAGDPGEGAEGVKGNGAFFWLFQSPFTLI